MEADKQKPYKVKDVSRNIKKAVVASTLEEIRLKAAEKFGKAEAMPTIHLDSDGTEIDDEDYFQTLEPNAELIAVFPGEEWMDPTHYVTITTHRETDDATDSAAEVEKVHLKKLVGQLRNNLCNVSVLSEPDLESLTNMDPNSLSDLTGKDFIEQLKEASGRLLSEKRQALNAVDLLKLLAKHKFVTSEQVSPTESNTPSEERQTPTTDAETPSTKSETETETEIEIESKKSETCQPTTSKTVKISTELATTTTTTTIIRIIILMIIMKIITTVTVIKFIVIDNK